jgi:hypothetical protein
MFARSARPCVSLPSWSVAPASDLSGTCPPNDGLVQSNGQKGPNKPEMSNDAAKSLVNWVVPIAAAVGSR